MNEEMIKILEEYEERRRKEMNAMSEMSAHELNARIDDFLIPVGPEVGKFLYDLAIGLKAKTILELGTSYGYSALWLGMAAHAVGGKLVSVDIAAPKQHYARHQIDRAGLSKNVEFVTGDAVQVIDAAVGYFDIVLVDLWKDLYIPCLDAVIPKLASPAYVIADNMIFPPQSREDARRYREHVRTRSAQTILLPIGNGIEVTRFD
jgi:predicted O-methyltransferase YrrM